MLRLSFLGLVILAIAGCGKSSNPVPEGRARQLYDRTVPGEQTNTEVDQTQAANNFLNIALVSSDQNGTGNFVEGTAGEVQVQITPYPGIPGYVITSTNSPAGSQIRATGNPNVWNFDWTPPAGTVPEDRGQKTISIHLVVAPKTNDPRYANFISQKDFDITVTKTRTTPAVLAIEDSSGGKVTEGGTVDFSVLVSDPSESQTPPYIAVSPYDPENKENAKYFGFIQPLPKDAQKLANGQWRKFFRFSMAGIAIGDSALVKDAQGHVKPGINSVKVCANFHAISVSSLASPSPKSYCWTVALQAQTPEFVFPGAPLTETPIQLEAGPQAKIEFTASIPNKRGVAVVKTSTNLAKWPGSANLNCINGPNGDASVQACTITWQDPCKAKGNFELLVSGLNSDSNSPASKASRHVRIAAPTAGCGGAPAVTAAAAPAPQVPVTPPAAAPASSKRVVTRGAAGALTQAQTETVPPTTNSGDSTKPANFKKKAAKQSFKAEQDKREAKLKKDQDAKASNTVPQTTESSGSAGGSQ